MVPNYCQQILNLLQLSTHQALWLKTSSSSLSSLAPNVAPTGGPWGLSHLSATVFLACSCWCCWSSIAAEYIVRLFELNI